ncbi:MAG: 6-carboxytetrahydropterin synthase QueD [Candidatus Omnitrophica bacterium]|nr:6-carboxytetrahydropterin synthase QueD [Candidatus Omnitrophota bacterium]
MYKLKIISHFSAAHSLREYKGKCEALHGHNWKVEVVVSAANVDSAGLVLDFSDLKKLTAVVLEELDHKHLNEIKYFTTHNPSSEEIARFIFINLKGSVAQKNCRLVEIRVWETENSCAIYQE